jgi:hypothetical protein
MSGKFKPFDCLAKLDAASAPQPRVRDLYEKFVEVHCPDFTSARKMGIVNELELSSVERQISNALPALFSDAQLRGFAEAKLREIRRKEAASPEFRPCVFPTYKPAS